MRNPFRWWLRSAEYRHLATALAQLEDDVLKCLKLTESLNARERTRARRAVEREPVADDSVPAPTATVQLVPNAADPEAPKVDRQTLRQRAKARGMM